MNRPRTPRIEPLEPRSHFSATIDNVTTVNASEFPGHQSEASVAIDPTNPSRVFAASNFNRTSLLAYTSGDGGLTWAAREVGTGADGLPPACCDPTAAFDEFGNLFFAYVNVQTGATEVLLSTDAGLTFRPAGSFPGDTDQPTVATGAGTVWVVYQLDESKKFGAAAHGAKVTGLGQVKKFGKARGIEAPPRQNIADLAVGPRGQVMVGYQRPPGGEGPSQVQVRVDPDGLGGKKFGPLTLVSDTGVGDRDAIPAQGRRTIDAGIGVAYDRSGGPFTGRAYLVYTDETSDESNDTDVLLRYTDDDGRTWSDAVRVNDDATAHSQFFPRVVVDQSTGNVALAWHDARADLGEAGVNSSNAIANDDAELWGVAATPTSAGVEFGSNVELSSGYSNAFLSGQLIEFGDYIGLDYRSGVLNAAWGDNSNSTGDNPNGTLAAMDIYAARATVTAPATVFGAPAARLTVQEFVRKGRTLNLTVTYATPGRSDVTGFDNTDLLITGPNGFTNSPAFVKAKARRGEFTATYRLPAPGGAWDPTDAGIYTVALRANEVFGAGGAPAAARELFGTFRAV